MDQSLVASNGAIAARVTNVTVQFGAGAGAVRGLDDISFDLREGELLVLVGRSGSGKTTALNVLAGLVEISRGEVSVLGQPPIVARPQLGYMFARDALLPWRSAIRNIELSLEIRGFSRAECKSRAQEFLKLVKLTRVASNYPSQLSQGQRQRVALARTWAPTPKLLLMDEPFSALDAETREDLHDEFVRMWAANKKSVVFVTHDLNEAITLADRILVFSEGRIVKEFAIPFERPRDVMEIATDPIARELYKEIRQLLYH